MSLLELGGNTFTIPVGEVVLGSDAGCAISLSGAGVLPRHAVLQGQADGQVIIRKASPAADVLINGVRLGAEPTPLYAYLLGLAIIQCAIALAAAAVARSIMRRRAADLSPLRLVGAGIAGIGLAVLMQQVIPAA